MVILVSGYIPLITQYRSVEKYIEYGKKLMNININKILFIDPSVIHHFNDYNTEFNTIIPYKLEDSYVYKLIYNKENKINDNFKFDVISDNPNKDTLNYMIIINTKTEWVKNAIEYVNPHQSEQFIWVDFGIYQLYDNLSNQILFEPYMYSLINKSYNYIRIPHIWNIDSYNIDINIHKLICWYFAGGIFGGKSELLIKFNDIMSEIITTYINQNNSLVWEVNLWYLAYKSNKSMFSLYYGNHDANIIKNY